MAAFLRALLREFYENDSGMSEEMYVETDKLIAFTLGDSASHVFRRGVDAVDGRFYINDDIGGFHDFLKAIDNVRDPVLG